MRKPTLLNQAMTTGPPASKVERYVKYLSDAEPKDGWPAYSIHHPGPDIAKPQTIPNGKFFGGPAFAIWIERGHHGPVCRPIRPHELIERFHLDHDIFEHNTNSEVVQRLRHIPGPHGLAALFHTIKFAEDAVWSDKSTLITGESVDVADWQQVPVFNFNLDPTMTCPLPSTQAWLDATDNDQDLVQI